MRKLVYLVASSIDGFIAESSTSDPSGTVFALEGDHAEFLTAEYPEMLPTAIRPLVGIENTPPRHFDTVLEGRGSYQIGLAAGIANAYSHLRHLVFSTTMAEAEDPDIELVSSDPVTRVRELKAEDGKDIWLCGGGRLAASLREEIDEIHLKLNPVVLGSGVPLFDPVVPADPPVIDRFALRSSRAFASGVCLLIFERR